MKVEGWKEIKPKYKPQIKEIMRCFDFPRVHRTMVALDWYWGTWGSVPTIDDLKECAKDLLKQAAVAGAREQTTYTIGTGGFEASLCRGVLHLQFVVADWSGEYE